MLTCASVGYAGPTETQAARRFTHNVGPSVEIVDFRPFRLVGLEAVQLATEDGWILPNRETILRSFDNEWDGRDRIFLVADAVQVPRGCIDIVV